MSQQVEVGPASVAVRNLGGIDRERLECPPGVTVLTGRNATNRTSMLRAIAAGLGGSEAALKVDAEDGAVQMEIGDAECTRRYRREGGDVRVSGDPYTDDEVLVDTFACILRSNPVRRAVEAGDGDALRDVLMGPVDTTAIRNRIESVQRELRTTADRLAELDRERERLPPLEQRRGELETELEAVNDDLAAAKAAVEAHEADEAAAAAAEAVLESLQEARADREAVRDELGTQRDAVEALEAEHESVRAELDGLTVPDAELDELAAELEHIQARERRLDHSINRLLSIIEFNEDLVNADGDRPVSRSGGEVLAGLDPDSATVECWTCGCEVDRGAIVEQLDDLRDLAAERRADRASLADRAAALRDQRQELKAAAEEEAQLRRRLASIEAEIEERERRIEGLQDQAATADARIEELEDEAAETEGLRDSEVLEQYERLSELEYERGRLERERATVNEAIADIEAMEEERAELEARRQAHREELQDLRTRIEDLERAVVEEFNQHASAVIDLLDYDNLDRVWIERKARVGGTGGDQHSTFDLHVVRTTDGGSALEDTVAHLSESERALVGLTAVLAGYLAHDVHETVPMVVLDSLEAIDADRIATLVDYFAEYVPYLLVALLPEDAAALDDEYHRIHMAAE